MIKLGVGETGEENPPAHTAQGDFLYSEFVDIYLYTLAELLDMLVVVLFELREQRELTRRQLFQAHFVNDALLAVAEVRAFFIPAIALKTVRLGGARHSKAHVAARNHRGVAQPLLVINLL